MTRTTEYSAMTAGNSCAFHAQRTQSQPAHMSAQAACGMWATASASILFIQTGVVAPVSLFVLLIIVGVLLLLVGLISLSCLTGLGISLVGLLRGLSPGTKTGD